MTKGLQHYQKKKGNIKHSDTQLHKTMDMFIYFVAISVPLMTIPQALIIWETGDSSSIALASWVVYFIAAIFWLVYASIHRDRPLIITSLLNVVVNFAVIASALNFR